MVATLLRSGSQGNGVVAAIASVDINFRALTYQELFEQLKTAPEPAVGYLDYLRFRYF